MTEEEKQNQERLKSLMIEQLKKTPIIQVACEKVQIGRSTFYRWKKEDKKFAENVSKAITDGTEFISDMAESRLIEAIRDKNLRAVFFWLKSHSNRYATKVELKGHINVQNEPLSDEQQALIEKALGMSGLISKEK